MTKRKPSRDVASLLQILETEPFDPSAATDIESVNRAAATPMFGTIDATQGHPLIAEAEAFCDPNNYNDGYDVDLVRRLTDAMKSAVESERVIYEHHVTLRKKHAELRGELADAKARAIEEYAELQERITQIHAYVMDDQDWDEHKRLMAALTNYAAKLRAESTNR